MLKKSFVACLFFVIQLTVFTNPVASQKVTQNFSTPATLLTSNSWSPPLQGTHLLANINQTNAGSHPMYFARFGEKVIFSAFDAVHGFEPWITDGTTNGTYMLKDINPSDTSLNPVSAYGFTEINGKSIFIGNDGVNESSLWVTDGSSAGTQILKDPSSACSSGQWCSTEIEIGPVFQSKRTVVIDDGVNGPEIWLTDGTSSGTSRITDLPGGTGSFLNAPQIDLYGSISDVFFFAYSESTNGKELWRTDGTISGTFMVKDIAPGTTSGVCGDRAYIANNWILFDGIGNSSGQMCRVWRTDGTEQGTFSLPYLSPIALYRNAHVFDDEIYLHTSASQVGYEWYVTDGSSSAARLVSDINPSYGFQTDSLRFVTDTSKFIFAASDGISGTELWKSDGTDSGTLRVADISPGSASSMPNSFFSFGEKAIFIADNGNQGKEWWITQGTSSTTQLLKDIGPGSASGATGEWTPSGIALSNTRAVFTANDGLNGPELWVTDGTSSGTQLLKNINEKSAGSNPTDFTQLDDQIIYVADDGVHGRELWATDRQGTRLVKDIYPGSESSSIGALKRFKDLVLFVANNGTNGSELWRTDGTEIGTFRLTDSKPGSESGVPNPGGYFGGSLGFVRGDEFFFKATDSEHGYELWATQGTVQTTALKADLTVGPSSSMLGDMKSIGNNALTQQPFSRDAWLIDFSSLTLSPLPTPMIGASTQFASGNLAIFTGTSANTGNEPWVTDGTISGTRALVDIYPGSVSSYPDLYTTFGNQIAFAATTISEGTEIWVTDGTAANTRAVSDFNQAGSVPGNPDSIHLLQILSIDNKLFVLTAEGEDANFFELHVLDPETKKSLKSNQFACGDCGSYPGITLTAMNGKTVMRASLADTGSELFVSTPDYPELRLTKDIRPGVNDSLMGGWTGGPVVSFGDFVTFGADDGVHGFEPWYSDGATAPDPPTEVTARAGDRLATISFAPPTSDGGSTVTSYSVTSRPEGITAVGQSSPIVVQGLQNGVDYTFDIQAVNINGASSPTQSNSIRPASTPSTNSLDKLGAKLTSNVFSVSPNGLVRVSLKGFVPFEWVTAVIRSAPQVIGTAQASAIGEVTFDVQVPSNIDTGLHTIYLYAPGSDYGGYAQIFVSSSGSSFATLNPSRIVNTRSGSKIGSSDGTGEALTINVYNKGGLPTSGIAAVALNVTAVDGENPTLGGGYVTVYPCALGKPDASNLNFTDNQTVPNMVIAPVDNNGNICFYVYGKTHLLADITGYFPE